MQGSEKQIKWAEQIKAHCHDLLANYRADLIEDIEDEWQVESCKEALRRCDNADAWIDTIDNASFFIDYLNYTGCGSSAASQICAAWHAVIEVHTAPLSTRRF